MTKQVKDYPQNLTICFSEGSCNLRCPMCQTFGDNKKYHTKDKDGNIFDLIKGEMDLEKAGKMLEELKGSSVVIAPSGQSELFAQKDYMLYLEMVKKAGLKMNINTNGLLLTDERAKQLVDIGLDGIYISIDAFTEETLKKSRGIEKLDKIKEAVFHMLKHRGDKLKPRIGVSFVVQEVNAHEKNAFVDYWIKYVDSVRVAELHARGADINFDLIPEEREPCQMLYDNMFVHYNGDVPVCCWDAFGRTNMGNVFEDGVQGVWLGEKFQQVRHYHETDQLDKIPFCQECLDWARYIYTDEEVVGDIQIRKSAMLSYYNRIDRLNTWQFGEGKYIDAG